MENKNRRPKRFGLTWTKQITKWLLIIGVINGMAPFVLSVFDKEPCVEMGIAWVTEIVAVALGYFVRGFKDTKESEKVRLIEENSINIDAKG
jgi:hypothetical protein